MSAISETSVLVVGGGPVGLVMAAELLRHGVDCRVIDKLAEPPVWSKAAAVHARTLEVFEDMGLVDQVLARGRKMVGLNMYAGARRLAHVTIDIPGTAYPYMLGIEQSETERLLRGHLQRLGGALERSVELVDFEARDDGVLATLRGTDGGLERVRADWLVGCDGARSTVRDRLGLAFEGSTFEQRLLQADVRLTLPFEVAPDEAVMFVSPAGAMGALPLLSEGRYRVIALSPPEEHSAESFESMQAIARLRAPEGVELSDPAWIAGFRFHGRLVAHYRRGRIFLAGDAAHIHSPAGAQGMNMGIQDAYNLAWKLALVHRGRARAELLDSYEPERRPVAEATVKVTDRGTKAAIRMLSLQSRLAQGLRNQIVSLVVNSGIIPNRAFKALGGLEVAYRDSPAVSELKSSIWSAKVTAGHDDEQPNVGDWFAFNRAPSPGERVRDLELAAAPSTLYALLRGTRHHLLLFDGEAATRAGYENLGLIAEVVGARFGESIEVHVVVPADTAPAALRPGASIVLDGDRRLHGHFGASSECLYLVRPDGYVGYRSQPASFEHLMEYLDRWFVAAA